MLSELGRSLRQRLSLPLPGAEAQYKMANTERRINLARLKVPENSRRSAVMILLYESGSELKMPLIIRPVYDGVHSGQVSLPGGSFEDSDRTLQQTAIRETEEETGFKVTEVRKVMEAYMSPGSVTELIYFFIAEYSSAMKVHDGGGIAHEQEDIEVLEISIDDAFKMINSGEIRDGKTIMLLQYIKLNGIL